MHKAVMDVFEIKDLTAGAQVTFFEPVALVDAILRCGQHKATNVKFPAEVKQWIGYIELTELKRNII